MTDFPGGMKQEMPAWKPGERCEEGLKINQELLIEAWQEKFSLKTLVLESWKNEGRQFFISRDDSGKAVMGVLCPQDKEIFLKIADKVEKYCNRNLFQELPCFGFVWAKTVIVNEERLIAFLSVITRTIHKKCENKEKEDRLLEAAREFEKERNNMPKNY
jgi:hypothetical protein